MKIKARKRPGSDSLQNLQLAVATIEKIAGPLLDLSMQGSFTFLVYDEDGVEAPDDASVAKLFIADSPLPSPKEGMKFVCGGLCLVGDQPRHIHAYRKL